MDSVDTLDEKAPICHLRPIETKPYKRCLYSELGVLTNIPCLWSFSEVGDYCKRCEFMYFNFFGDCLSIEENEFWKSLKLI